MSTAKKEAQAALDKLTPQRRKFVLAYCACLNATKAALAAGYSEKTARTQGSQLLTILDIKQAVQELLSHAGADPEEIAARWDRLARVDLGDFYSRERVEHTPKIEKSLREVVEEYRRYVEFEEAVAIRTEALIGDNKARAKFRKQKKREALPREMRLLRLEMELENDPDGVRVINGPTRLRDELRLDLEKAESLGILDLVKTVTNGRNGTSFSLRDADAALDNLAKWRGMLTTKVDLTSGGQPVTAPPLLGVLSLEEKKRLLDAKRQAQEGPADA